MRAIVSCLRDIHKPSTIELVSKKVLIFGTFDGLHDGHHFFISEAKNLGDELVICVARDSVVEILKNKRPVRDMSKRIEDLKTAFKDALVVAGDENIDTWEILEEHRPDLIALGYDQGALHKALSSALPKFPFLKEIIIIKDHRGDELHSSLLN